MESFTCFKAGPLLRSGINISNAANHNAPIILAKGNLSDQVINYLKGKKLTGATLLGGEAAVSKGIEQQLGQLIGK